MDPLWDESKMDKPTPLLKYNVPTCYQSLPLETIHRIREKQALPFSLMFYNLNGDINVGMALRSAAIFGCTEAYVVGRRSYDKRSAVGANKYLTIHRHASIPKTFFEDQKLLPILMEQGGEPLEDFNFKPYLPGYLAPGWRVVLIVGTESSGLPKEFLANLSTAPKLSISQPGILRSLNVCNAASIALYEYQKQWRKNAMSRI